MTDIICPNCHSVTAPFTYCLDCNAALGRLDEILAAQPVPAGAAGRSEKVAIKSGGEDGVQMDAHLRRACRRTPKHGICRLPTSSTAADEVSVIAKVTDLAKFDATLINRGRIVTQIPGAHGEPVLLTARIRADEREMEMLRSEPYVKSLKGSRRIRPHLERLTGDIFAGGGSSPLDHTNGGDAVIIGIIDFGLDFVHRNFRDREGNSRILALWDQKAAPCDDSPKPFGYGRVFSKSDIDNALKTADPHGALEYSLPKDGIAGTGAHGTYVADVAAGNGLGSGCRGVAPGANIVFVDIATSGTPIHSQHSVGNTFGDSAQLLEAIAYIFEFAKKHNKPCVINVSLGTDSGPHDGTTLVEEAIDRLVTQEPNRAVVIAAGNSFGKALHATGKVPADGYVDLKWRIPRFESTGNELEIWYPGHDRLTVEVIDPDGTLVAHVDPGEHWEKGGNTKGLITVVNRLREPNNGENTITMFFERGVRDGVWTVRLHGRHAERGDFHAWIERNERGQSRFLKSPGRTYAINNQCTLNSIACGRESIVVGSYNAYENDLPLSELSSSGPTRDNRDEAHRQPTLCAPGDLVLAAQSGTKVLRHRESGTSMSAAAVTGTVALTLAEAYARGIDLSSAELRKILIDTVRPGGGDWSQDAGGAGRLDASAAIAAVQNLQANSQKHDKRIRMPSLLRIIGHRWDEATTGSRTR
jgi:subtilisin family serine protease